MMTIKIKDEAKLNEAMRTAWVAWHENTPEERIPSEPNISFEKAFRFCWQIVEQKQADIDMLKAAIVAKDDHSITKVNNLLKMSAETIAHGKCPSCKFNGEQQFKKSGCTGCTPNQSKTNFHLRGSKNVKIRSWQDGDDQSPT